MYTQTVGLKQYSLPMNVHNFLTHDLQISCLFYLGVAGFSVQHGWRDCPAQRTKEKKIETKYQLLRI